jgi:hypothetical protein
MRTRESRCPAAMFTRCQLRLSWFLVKGLISQNGLSTDDLAGDYSPVFELLWKSIWVLQRAFHHCLSAVRRPGERGHWALITEAVAFVCGHKSAEER